MIHRFCASGSTDGPSVYFGAINGGGDDEWVQTCECCQGNGDLHRGKPLFMGLVLEVRRVRETCS